MSSHLPYDFKCLPSRHLISETVYRDGFLKGCEKSLKIYVLLITHDFFSGVVGCVGLKYMILSDYLNPFQHFLGYQGSEIIMKISSTLFSQN